MTIQWRRALSLDGGIIDDDHRHLIGIINRFERDADGEDPRLPAFHALVDLKHYARVHFRREERLMRDVGYPQDRLREHQARHRELEARIDMLIQHFDTSIDADDFHEVTWEISDLLKHWLLEHIVKADLPIKPYLKRRRREASAPLAGTPSGGTP
ncbi:MAG TPA: hemerythrin family protein [Azospirillum sp.]|nr:hemerythrin family protein [Azospirillum sp.]